MITSTAGHVTPQSLNITRSNDGSIRGLEDQKQYYIIVLETVIFILVWAMALLGNVLVVLVIHRSRRMQSTTNYFVVSVAFSDMVLILLSSTFVGVDVIMQKWAIGHVMCRLTRFIQFFSMSSASFVLVAICIDRFYTIIHPLSFKVTRGTAKKMIIIAWLSSFVISSMCIYFFDQVAVTNFDDTNQISYVCPTYIPASQWAGIFYAAICVTVQYVCPLASVAFGYSRIFAHIWSIRRQVRRCRSSKNPVPGMKIKTLKMLIVLSIITLLLYLPFYVTHVVYCFTYRNYFSASIFVTTFWLICASAVAKPVIYACGNNNFWRGCKEVLCMSTMKCYRFNTYIITNASSISKKNYVGAMDLSKEQAIFQIDSELEPFHFVMQEEKFSWPANSNFPFT